MYAPKTRKRSNGDDLLALRRDLIPSVTGLSEVPVAEAEPVPPPAHQSAAVWPVKALAGVRREVDGCQRVVRILWQMSDETEVWVDYADLLSESNWTSG